MIRTLLLIPAAALAVSALAAHAAERPQVAAAFGNTVMSVYDDGRSQKVWLKDDGTWTGLSRRGNPLAGKWSTKGDQVCLRQSKPPTLPISFCRPFPADPEKGIDTKDITGAHIHLKLVKGHIGESQG
ncbi:MAG TPA: hypothetical protein VIE16_04320 [Phenylobacterium sp.]|jgi:hypothetical protein